MNGFVFRKRFVISLLFMVVLVSSCFVSVFSGASSFVSAAPDCVVSTETELRNAVNNAPSGVPYVVAFTTHIYLETDTLIIPKDKNITLITDGLAPWNLTVFGNPSTIIIVERGGVLSIDGVGVSRQGVFSGYGVEVKSGGEFYLYSGLICGNGVGVFNGGNFVMSGGTISDNTDRGVSNSDDGFFVMSDGKISNNAGGVYNSVRGGFSMSGGEISGNTLMYGGGGVANGGNFFMSGGVISNNTSWRGGGVLNEGVFALSGGVISNNTARQLGGSNHGVGGGVYNNYGYFCMFGGMIANNTAAANGGGVCNTFYNVFSESFLGNCSLFGGLIANNTAANAGGGVGVYDIFVPIVAGLEHVYVFSNDVVFSNNRAPVSFNRASAHDALYNSRIRSGVTWTAPFTQGYNNYDISYVRDYYYVSVPNSFAVSSGEGNYPAGGSVTINAGTRSGYTFSGWTVTAGGVTLSSSTSATTSFIMPERDVVVTANWTLDSSSGGSGSGGGGSSGGGSGSGGGSDGGNDGSSPSPSPSTPTPSKPTPSEPAPSELTVLLWICAILFVSVVVVVFLVFLRSHLKTPNYNNPNPNQ